MGASAQGRRAHARGVDTGGRSRTAMPLSAWFTIITITTGE